MTTCGIYYCTASNYSGSSGIMPVLYALRDSIPGCFVVILLTIWFILIAGQYFLIKNKTGRGKILTALLSSSIVLTVLSLFLALAQLVGFITVLFFAFCSIVVFVLYLLSEYW